jgi:hypothetical protein
VRNSAAAAGSSWSAVISDGISSRVPASSPARAARGGTPAPALPADRLGRPPGPPADCPARGPRVVADRPGRPPGTSAARPVRGPGPPTGRPGRVAEPLTARPARGPGPPADCPARAGRPSADRPGRTRESPDGCPARGAYPPSPRPARDPAPADRPGADRLGADRALLLGRLPGLGASPSSQGRLDAALPGPSCLGRDVRPGWSRRAPGPAERPADVARPRSARPGWSARPARSPRPVPSDRPTPELLPRPVSPWRPDRSGGPLNRPAGRPPPAPLPLAREPVRGAPVPLASSTSRVLLPEPAPAPSRRTGPSTRPVRGRRASPAALSRPVPPGRPSRRAAEPRFGALPVVARPRTGPRPAPARPVPAALRSEPDGDRRFVPASRRVAPGRSLLRSSAWPSSPATFSSTLVRASHVHLWPTFHPDAALIPGTPPSWPHLSDEKSARLRLGVCVQRTRGPLGQHRSRTAQPPI